MRNTVDITESAWPKAGQRAPEPIFGEGRDIAADDADLRMAIEPLLEARNMMRKQKAVFDRQLGQMARKDVCKRLMTVSGVGPIVSLLFRATIDDPSRFKDSKAVAAHRD